MGFVLTLFYLFTTLLTPGEVMPPELLAYRIMLILLLVTLLASLFTAVGTRFTFQQPQLVLILLLVCDASATVLFAMRWLAGALDAMLEVLFLAGIVLMVGWTVTSVSRLRILALLLAAVGTIYTVDGILAIETGYRQSTFVVQVRLDDAGLITSDRIQGLGGLNDANDLAQYLLITTALLGCWWRPRRLLSNLFFVVVPGLILLTGVYLTRSRGAILGTIGLVLLLLQKRLGKIGSAIGIVGGVIGLLAMTALTGRGVSMSESSAAGRLDAWYAGMQMLKQSPLFGVGFNRFAEHNSLTAHNSYILCAAELGFPGMFVWLGLIVSSLFRVRSISLGSGDTPEIQNIRRAARAVYVALIMFAVTAWFLSRSYATILFILIGCAVAVTEIAGRSGMVENARPNISWKPATAFTSLLILASIYIILRVRGFSA